MANRTFEQFGVLGLYTETPLHCGTENTTVGYVDLPIQRERHTEYPVIPGATIKGVLRDECSNRPDHEKHVEKIFGRAEKPKKRKPTTTPAGEAAGEEAGTTAGQVAGADSGNGEIELDSGVPGTVAFGDGILVAFPVRSSLAPFHWVTCPFVLERALRLLGKDWNANGLTDETAWAEAESAPVLLEELELTIEAKAEVKAAVTELLKILPAGEGFTYTQEIFRQRLLVVNDANFRHLVTTCTDAVTRIKLNYFGTTRTITKPEEIEEIRQAIDREPGPEELQGNMFVEELMPPECLFLSPLRAAQEPDNLTKAFKKMPVIRLGGDETIGRGVTHLRYVPVTRGGGEQ